MKILPARAENYIKSIRGTDIKGILLYGEEGVLSYRADYIKNIFQESEAITIDLNGDQNTEDVFTESFIPSFFHSFKFLNITGESESRFAGIEYIISKIDGAFPNFLLIKAYCSLDNKSKLRKICEDSKFIASIACYRDDKETIITLINEFLKENKLQMNAQTVDYIAENFKDNRKVLISELEKIKIYKREGMVSFLEVRAIAEEVGEADITSALNTFFYLNAPLFLKEIEKLRKEALPASVLFTALVNQTFKYLEYLLESANRGVGIDVILKEKFIFFRQMPIIISHLKKWNIEKINSLLMNLYDREVEIRKNIDKGYEILINSFMQFL